MSNDVVIIGGGSSGLMARALLRGKSITIERGGEVGRKLLITGGGRCNLTHMGSPGELEKAFFEKKNFVRSALYSFPPDKIRDFFRKIGVDTYSDESGRVYPKTGGAVKVRDALLNEKGRIYLDSRCTSLEKRGDVFLIGTEKGTIESKYVIVASGGCSFPATGSDGSFFKILSSIGHDIIPRRPALSPIHLSDNRFGKLSGISISAVLSKGKIREEGELLFTRNGLSGPVAENFSRNLEGKDSFTLSFTDDPDSLTLDGNALVKNTLSIPGRLAEVLFPSLCGKKTSELGKKEKNAIRTTLSGMHLEGSSTWNGAMSSRGGVDVKEIDPKSMESKIVKGLYILGDALDVDAKCGGYSLTFAFSSAYLAAKDIFSKEWPEDSFLL